MDKVDLLVTIAETGTDAEGLDELTGWLRGDLIELGVDQVRAPEGEAAPSGAKGDAVTIGALALVLAADALPKLIEFLAQWTMKSDHRHVKIKTPSGFEIEFTPKKQLDQAEVLALAKKLNRMRS